MALSMTAGRTSAFTGTPVRAAPVRSLAHRRAVSRRAAVTKAKYGDESQFFDLDDLENTAGSWDLYGKEDERRYPSLQNEFFERAAAPVLSRQGLLTIAGFGGIAGILLWGRKGSKDIGLPIQNGPQKGGEKGPRGKL
ncbi:hypothetical protein WJX73_002473 [Symbiochloris irregularis]|uniref:Uncharacterized protein n=1 Tax=Symbiochloris irregularis TaxID=706552 RepID=A0AAW1PI15_9CHLO